MKTEKIIVDNLKCNGCANTISKNIRNISGVAEIEIELEKSELTISCEDEIERADLIKSLSAIGYPEQGTSNLRQKATSYVSCMIGRVGDNSN